MPLPAQVHRAGALVWWGAASPREIARRATGADATASALHPLSTEGGGSARVAPRGGGGAGVVIGVVDHAPALEHPALVGPDGPAVEALWDQRDGRRLDRAAIASALRGACALPRPGPTRHGMAVAGIAAGRSAGGVTGAAPDASLIWVCPPTWREIGGWELHPGGVEAGIDYIEAVAAGRPSVLLLALERHAGPGDGSSSLAARLRRFMAAGGYVVSAAGNGGGQDRAFQIRVAPRARLSWRPEGERTMCLWYRGALEARVGALALPPAAAPRAGAARRVGAAWVTHLDEPPGAGPGWRALGLTSAAPIELHLASSSSLVVLARPPAAGRLEVAPEARGLGALGEPASLPGVIAAGIDDPRGARGRQLDGARAPTVHGPARFLAPSLSGWLPFGGTSASAGWVAGRLASAIARGADDPLAALRGGA